MDACSLWRRRGGQGFKLSHSDQPATMSERPLRLPSPDRKQRRAGAVGSRWLSTDRGRPRPAGYDPRWGGHSGREPQACRPQWRHGKGLRTTGWSLPRHHPPPPRSLARWPPDRRVTMAAKAAAWTGASGFRRPQLGQIPYRRNKAIDQWCPPLSSQAGAGT